MFGLPFSMAMQPLASRLVWIDAARGAAVALVVLMHFVFWVNLPLAADEPIVRVWRFITVAFAPFRMSLLFALAGLLTSRYVLRGWSSQKVRSRVVDGTYLFFLWTCIYGLFSLIPLAGMGMPYGHGTIFLEFVAPTTPLWFIAGIALWTAVIAMLAPRLSKWTVLSGLALMAVMVATLWQGLVPARVLYYGFFFAVGVYGGPWLREYGSKRRPWLAAGAALVVILAKGLQLLWPRLDPVGSTAAGLAGIVVAIYVVAVACRLDPVGRVLSWVGQRTLTVYVLHVPLVLLVSALVTRLELGEVPALNFAGPLIGTVAIVSLTAAAHDSIARSRLSFLLRPPRLKRFAGQSGAGAG